MTGTELLRRLRIALDDAEEPYTYSTDRLWRWMQSSYMAFQRASTQWDFMHKRGLFLKTVVDETDYTVGNVREIAEHSIFYTAPGSDSHQPMLQQSYENWSEQEQSSPSSSGPPRYLIEMPDKKWKVDLTPDRTYYIYADWWLLPTEMTGMDDSPVWAEEFHEILLYEAMTLAAGLNPDSSQSALMLAEVATFYPPLRHAFNMRYAPGMSGPGALV